MDVPSISPYEMIQVEKALEIITNSLSSLPVQAVQTLESLNAVLAVDVFAPGPFPPFRASIKDGYAIGLNTKKCPLVVRTETLAGDSYSAPLQLGDAAYVTTGAPVPLGADAVVMVENCQRKDDCLFIQKWPSSGQDIREVGSDLASGQLVLPKGTFIGAAEIGLLAACCITSVPVVSRPVVGVLSTGDEVVDLTHADEVARENFGKLPVGKIVDSNRPMLLAAVREALPFCDAVDLGNVKDDYSSVKSALTNAVDQCNIVITSGGVSMGRRDIVKPVLGEIANVHFGRVIMKPGKPLTFATLSGKTDRCFVALPGNPVSCFVCFHLAVTVAARRLAGWGPKAVFNPMVEASLDSTIKLDPERPEYHRATLRWVENSGYVATSTGIQASSRLLSARSANALLLLPAQEAILPAGAKVKALVLNGTVKL